MPDSEVIIIINAFNSNINQMHFFLSMLAFMNTRSSVSAMSVTVNWSSYLIAEKYL